MAVATPIRQCLQDALRPGLHPHAWSALDDPAAVEVTNAAMAHRVEGWVRRRVEAVGMRSPRALDLAVHAALARHQRAVADLRRVAPVLDAVGVEFLVVKGPALVTQFYAGPELRSSVDLDLLVRPAHVAQVLETLEQAGWTLLDANWPLLTHLRVHELRLLSPSGGMIDLHWSLGAERAPRNTCPTADVLFARSCELTIESVRVRTLDWADTVVHLAVHAASSGGDRLIWYADLRGALAAAPSSGAEEALVDRAAEWGAGPALQLMLLRGRRAIGLQPSRTLLRGLGDGGLGITWTGLVRATDRLMPVAGAIPGRPSVRRIVARSAKRDAGASWLALMTKTARALPRRGSSAARQADARSGLFPAGGARGRAMFLNQVTRASSDSPR